MANNVISKFKQNIIEDIIDSFDSPVRTVTILAGGSDYANGDVLVFTGEGTPASGVILTDDDGAIKHVAITNGGNYVIRPEIAVSTLSGFGAALKAEIDNDHFYLFAARSKPYLSDNVAEPNYENDYDSHFFMHEQMLFGKKLLNTDVIQMTRVINWTANTVYAEYDDKDKLLPSKNFYVVTTDKRVYKCIFNNGGNPSLVPPTNIATDGMPATNSDGYRWKYMYTIDGITNTRFTTPRFMPIVREKDVANGAISGGILNIKVETGGTAYPANVGQIKAAANGVLQITISNTASIQSNYYADSTLTVFGNNNIVTNRKIVGSGQVGAEVVLQLANTWVANQISAGHSYSIGPTLTVTGDGTGFDGYCVMNQDSQSISRVEIIDAGSGYNQAEATVTSGFGFGSGASVRAIISPPNGHGHDAVEELFCERLGISGEFSNTLPFPTNVTVRTFGILKNPTYANGAAFTEAYFNQCFDVAVANTSAQTFDPGETVIGVSSRARGQVAFSNSSHAIITGYTGNLIPNELLRGTNSGATFTVLSVGANPDAIKVYSGDVMYIQNISPAERSNTSSEQVKLVVKI